VLPVFQEGAALAGSLATGKADGIIFDAVEKVERVVRILSFWRNSSLLALVS